MLNVGGGDLGGAEPLGCRISGVVISGVMNLGGAEPLGFRISRVVISGVVNLGGTESRGVRKPKTPQRGGRGAETPRH